MSKVQELVNKLKEFEEKFKQESRAVFAEGCRELFANNPELESFGFKNYCPYFCDGDPCRFGVYADYADINGIDGYEIYSIKDGAEKGKLERLQESVRKFIYAFPIPTDSFEKIFGDNSAVTVYRDGRIVQEEYSDHD